jgi:hypothetical protein
LDEEARKAELASAHAAVTEAIRQVAASDNLFRKTHAELAAATARAEKAEAERLDADKANGKLLAEQRGLHDQLAEARRQVAICVSALTRVRDWNDQEEADDQGQIAARALVEARKGA